MSTIPFTPDRRARRDAVFSVIGPDFEIQRGHPLPLGVSAVREGLNFAVFSQHATGITLVLFLPGEEESLLEFPLDPDANRTGDVWHLLVRGLDPGIEYGWRAVRGPDDKPAIHRYNPADILVDPYARALSGGSRWGETLHLLSSGPGRGSVRKRYALVADESYDWEDEHPLRVHLAESVIYELHVRGFTRHPSSGVAAPGSFAGLVEKIPYLKDLGVTAVELMPVTEFEENDNPRVNPFTGEVLKNFWGYHPVSFFAPKAAYASDPAPGAAVREFKDMVRAFHRAGIEVILDMVFNHTAEGDERGPTLSFRGLDNMVYYIVDPATGEYANFSGCGNTLRCNHPVVRSMITDCLRFWVTEMHVDGFRFDLASILGRGREGEVLASPPLIEQIAGDPVLAGAKLIAEAWDAAGLYQVGTFPHWGRWAEWNGRFRDDVRRFVKGDAGMVGAIATRLSGSPDLYQDDGRSSHHSINFVTCHDGLTLRDLVSFSGKHNEANGEENRDGIGDDLSWNCGVEGTADNPAVEALRRRQVRNFAVLLLLSQGVPMILGGDEFGRTQQGNNNAYCQDNDITWVDWRRLERNPELHRFFRLLLRYRREHPILRGRRPVGTGFESQAPEFVWHGVRAGNPDWSWESRCLAVQLRGEPWPDEFYLAFNMHWEPHDFELPAAGGAPGWRRVLDTARESPADISEPGAERAVRGKTCTLAPRSTVVLRRTRA